ncbi:class I SAM-dependent methyltransferase [Dactylosporangium sp. CA-139066]|uniref:class I SAM-dependent methyltransferase n=1 Tax=Dactylosporangium sp. CA-139066 TaxID=3239930 RepID=UPI003D914306
MDGDRQRVRAVRERLSRGGPPRIPRDAPDFRTVTLPPRECDLVRDLFVEEGVRSVVEVGLAYASSALAIGEALVVTGGERHYVVDPFQRSAYGDVGWELLVESGADRVVELLRAGSSVALPGLVERGVVVDAAFVDGSHRFHEVFLDLYYLRKLVRAHGIVVVDDYWAGSVRAAVRYYEHNLGWAPLERLEDSRCRAYRLPEPFEPAFENFVWPGWESRG